ncbi:hypothetical protein ACQPZF_21610 [Actinosynnema sp. CS-041913]|uniref:hypothetical protein n=1 Tax=Actinosynnema sp. CS-041913 TaxID=3239917 RepID=UPI003D8F8788
MAFGGRARVQEPAVRPAAGPTARPGAAHAALALQRAAGNRAVTSVLSVQRDGPGAEVGSAAVPAEPTPAERASGPGDQAAGPDVRGGLAALSATTADQAVEAVARRLAEADRREPDRHGAAVRHPPDGNTPLLSLTQDIWYVAHGLYVLDRSGHIAPGDFSHQLAQVTVAPGTYFFGTFAIRGTASTVNANLLIRLGVGRPEVATGDVGVRSVQADEIPLRAGGQAAIDAHHGIAAIVSESTTRRPARGHRTDHLNRIMALVPRHAEWQVRADIANFLADPAEAAVDFVTTEVAGRIAAAAAGGPVVLAYFLGRDGLELIDHLIIGSRARATDDEIDIAAQAVARQIVAVVCGLAVGRGLGRAGALLRGARAGALSRGGRVALPPGGRVALPPGGRAPHVGAAGPRRQPRNLAYNPRGAFAEQCVAITAAVTNNVARRGFIDSPADIEAAHGSTGPVRSGRGSNRLVALPGLAMDYIMRATGRQSAPSSLTEMNDRPGEYIVFLNDRHVYYARVRPDGWCSIVDAQIGRGWGGPTATAAWRRMLGQEGGGRAAHGHSGPRPHPGVAPKLSDNSFKLWRLRDP